MVERQVPVLTAEPQAWEFEPINAIAICDFSLQANSSRSGYLGEESANVLIGFKAGDNVVGKYTNREYISPPSLCVDFEKNGFNFRLNAKDFFRLFNELAND